MRGRDSAGDRGLTLVELVIAMAVFALVATMGLQAMTGSLRLRDRLLGMDDETAELGLALAMLRADLSQAVPILFHPPGSDAPLSAISLAPDGRLLSLSVAGQEDLPPRRSLGLHRAEWRLDPEAQQLTRRVWPTLWPASAGLVSPEIVVLEGVETMSVRSYWDGEGWIDGVDALEALLGGAGAPVGDEDQPEFSVSYTPGLPRALELTLETRAYDRLVILESFE